jgi:hypothetical protein
MNEEIELLDKIMDAMTSEEQELALDNRFAYIFTKAHRYLKVGPEIYRKDDFFEQPSIKLSKEELALIESGCKQILQGKGLTAENPLTELHIGGFYRLFELFHFKTESQQMASMNTKAQKGILDKMYLKHLVDGSEVAYYNLVEY